MCFNKIIVCVSQQFLAMNNSKKQIIYKNIESKCSSTRAGVM